MTDIGNSSVPRDIEDFDQKEMIEFKDVIKQLINKEHSNVVQLEEKILAKMKKKALSRGWERQTGVKVAPLKILAQLTTR
jgi:predicted DNA binding CopG/RHH family protein